MRLKQIEGLLLKKIIDDLNLSRAQLEESEDGQLIQIYENVLEINDNSYSYEIEFPFYATLCSMLIRACPHYGDVLGDLVYNALNQRTHNKTAVDQVCTHCTIVRQWSSLNGSLSLKAIQVIADVFKACIFETGGEWLVALRFKRRSWEYFASRIHTSEIAKFPYICDLFTGGKVEESQPLIKLTEILDKCLPDWHPLLRCSSLG